MKKIRTILKGLIISVSTLAAGFLALALPFKMFANLSRHDMQVLFLAEIVVYFIMSMTYLIFRDKKETEKERNEERRVARREKFERAQKEYYDLAA